MPQQSKPYRVTVHGGGELDNAPSVAVFTIDEECARRIVGLQAVCAEHDLHKVESFNCRAEFLRFDPESEPEDAEEAGEDNSVRTECDVLVVGKEEFYFSTYVKHTDARVSCEGLSIAALAEHFGIALPAAAAA